MIKSDPVRTGETRAAFDSAARRYDLLVGLNPGYAEHLRAAADQLAAALPRSGPVSIVDLGCDSGLSTQALLDAFGPDRVVQLLGVDASAGMLAEAEHKSWPDGVSFVQGAAEDVPVDGPSWPVATPVDGIFAAYLFRNVAQRQDAVQAVHDALRPGGELVVQDYSVAGTQAPRVLWTAVCWSIVIPLSAVVSRDTRLYRYLWRSVLAFDSVERFTRRLTEAGFVDVEVSTVGGWQKGILHTWRGRRPS